MPKSAASVNLSAAEGAMSNADLAFTITTDTNKTVTTNNVSYALVVVACNAGMDWLLDVPKEWRIIL
jgi:hypothetical protein